MSADQELIDIINNHTRTIEQLTGILETQRLMIEDLYAHIYTNADSFRSHAENLASLPAHGHASLDIDPELLEVRRAASKDHLSRAMRSAAERIERRHR